VQLVDHLDQVGLVCHDLRDGLVSIGVLVDELLGEAVVPGPAGDSVARRRFDS